MTYPTRNAHGAGRAGNAIRSLLPGAFAIALALGGARAAGATDLVTARIDTTARTALPAQRAGWAKAAADQGRVPDGVALDRLSLALKRSPERQQAFDRFLHEQQDPSSPNYQRWLTPTEVGERFGASRNDIDALSNWLRAQGLTVEAVANSRMRITFSGSASNIAAAFGTELHYYAAGKETRIANATAPSIPSALTGAVRSVVGLSTITFRPMLHVGAPQSAQWPQGSPRPMLTNCTTTPCQNVVFPADFAKIYNLEPVTAQGIDGSGQSIAIVARTRVYKPDVENFQSLAGFATKYPTEIVPPNGTDPGAAASTCNPDATATPNCSKPGDAVMDQSEATLDVQRATSVAPGATIKLITSGKTGNSDGVFIALDYAIDTDPVPAKVLSVSYGTCEADNTADALNVVDEAFKQAAMEGISVFVSSGDGGVDGCAALDSPPPASPQKSTNLLCASGYATCVGGTEFADKTSQAMYWGSNGGTYGSALGYIPEGAWNEPQASDGTTQMAATGGGVSGLPKPSWQVGTGIPGNAGRYTPDVSFNASTREGYFTCMAAQQGSCEVGADNRFHLLVTGGTSASAPSMAGIAALLNQKTGSAQANLNPRLYALAANAANGVFHDITVASSGVGNCTLATPSPCNNSTPGPSGLGGGLQGYSVGAGYDLATGLGSIDVAKLLDQWSSATPTSIALNQHGLSGSWADPTTTNQGFVMEIDPDFYGSGTGLLFAGWYTFDVTAAGGQRWYTLQAQVNGTTPASVGIYSTTGGRFDSSQATSANEVGRATLAFSDCTHGTLDYAFNDGSGRSGRIPLTRLLSNTTCSPTGDSGSAAVPTLLSGAWADAGTSGQGLVFDMNGADDVIFAGWYTYSPTGASNGGAADQRWYTLQATFKPGTSTPNGVGIYESTGGVFDAAASAQTTQVGTGNLVFNSCTSATLKYTFTGGANNGRSGTLDLTRIGAVPSGCHL